MKTQITVALAATFTTSILAAPYAAATEFVDIQNAIANGSTDITLRYRYERVDQDSLDKKANASTLLTRLSYQSANLNGFFSVIEFDHVAAIGNENFNSTVNGKSTYPVVADPIGSDLNQAFLGYKTETVTVTAGRQRINHDNQRFVGGVGWRQNEQTYDGYRLQYNNQHGLNLDYSYVYNVNRIFGTDSPNSDLGGNLHLLNATFRVDKNHKFTGYAYELDFDTAIALATRTMGVSYDGTLEAITIHAAYATQSDTGDNTSNFSTQYLALEVATKISNVSLGVGYESLGSDNGKGFTTPLATLHKFQGFTDKFLATPAQGVNDLYVKASGKVGKLGLTAVWHQLKSDVNSIDYGNELNLVAKYPLANKVGLLVKYANYSADDFSVDTNKLWGMVTVQF